MLILLFSFLRTSFFYFICVFFFAKVLVLILLLPALHCTALHCVLFVSVVVVYFTYSVVVVRAAATQEEKLGQRSPSFRSCEASGENLVTFSCPSGSGCGGGGSGGVFIPARILTVVLNV